MCKKSKKVGIAKLPTNKFDQYAKLWKGLSYYITSYI